MAHPPNLERHRQIIKMRASGMTYQAIGDRLGVTHQAIHDVLKRNGYQHTVQFTKLRAQGLTLQEIGNRLGVSRQYVHQQLQQNAPAIILPGIPCCACAKEIAPKPWGRGVSRVFCLSCLPADAAFGERLRAYRVAAQLTQGELANRVGVLLQTIYKWERHRIQPRPSNVAKLGSILGESFVVGIRRPIQRRVTIACRECGNSIVKLSTTGYRKRMVWCLECLAKHPEATVGQRLLSHRLAAGMTQRELAEKAGIWRASVAWYERDKGMPRRDNLVKLTRVLGPGVGAQSVMAIILTRKISLIGGAGIPRLQWVAAKRSCGVS